jgi:hypothetical protein
MATQTRVPTAIGGAIWTVGAGSDRVDAVDDTVGAHDSDTTYIFTTGSGQRQDYTFSAFTVPAGSTINSLIVHGVLKYVGTTSDARLNIRNEADAISEGADFTVTSSYVEYTRTLATNPWTAASWTVNEINTDGATSNRLAKMEIRSIAPNTDLRCTALWLEVDYTPAGGGSSVKQFTMLGVG